MVTAQRPPMMAMTLSIWGKAIEIPQVVSTKAIVIIKFSFCEKYPLALLLKIMKNYWRKGL